MLNRCLLLILLICLSHSAASIIPQQVSTKVSVYDDIFFSESGLIPLPENAIELERALAIESKQWRFPLKMAADTDGNIYASDTENGTVFKFSQEGDFKLQIGRKGRRKGELLAPYDLLMENGRLVIHDMEKRRLEYFDLQGTYIKSQRIAGLNDIISDGRGRLYAAHHVQGKADPLVSVYVPDKGKATFGKPLSFTHSMQMLNSRSLALDENGDLLVAFTYFPLVRKYPANGGPVEEYRIENPIMEAKENYNLKRIGAGVAQQTQRVGYRAIIIDIAAHGDKLYLLSHVPRLEIIEMDSEGNITATYWKDFQEVYETNDLLVLEEGGEIRFYVSHSSPPKYKIDVFRKKNKKYQGGLKGEIEQLTEEIRAYPKLFMAWNNRGIARHRLGDYEGAIEDLAKAIELSPESALAYNNRGLSKIMVKDSKGAVDDFSKAIELDPKNAVAYYNRGIGLTYQGKFKEAIRDFEQASLLDQNLATKAQEQIRFCMSRKKNDESLLMEKSLIR